MDKNQLLEKVKSGNYNKEQLVILTDNQLYNLWVQL